MGQLLQQHTFVCGRVFTLKPRALGDVFDCQEDLLYLVAKPVDFARVEHLNITLAANSVGRLLVQYTCQKPLHRAIERDGSLVWQWLEKDRNSGRWPRKQGADYFGDAAHILSIVRTARMLLFLGWAADRFGKASGLRESYLEEVAEIQGNETE